MEAWQQLLNTATLGTDKSAPDGGGLPEVIRAQLPRSGEAELDLLRQLTALSLYRRSGWVPEKREVQVPKAAPEERPYCNRDAQTALGEVLAADNMPLLKLWLQHCEAAGQIVPPDYLDRLLDIAARQKTLRASILACGGHRAAWLCGFNPDWNFAPSGSEEEQWATGRPEERRALLHRRRRADPAGAVQLLQAGWDSEDAASKTAFLEVIGEELSSADVPFLERLLSEKSKKVREAVLQLLRRLPGSRLVQLYWNAARPVLSLQKEKSMLGLRTREVLKVMPPDDPDPALFANGMEKTSPVKGLSDGDFLLQQLVLSVPPSNWNAALQLPPEEIIHLLKEEDKGSLVLAALAKAAGQFGDHRWAAALARTAGAYYHRLLPLLEGPLKEEYLLRLFTEEPDEAVALLLAQAGEGIWPEALAAAFLQKTATALYTYHRGFFSLHAHHLPAGILEKLDDFKPAEIYLAGMWNSIVAQIRQLVQLRDHIAEAFSPHNQLPS